jgi:hypothetical protein
MLTKFHTMYAMQSGIFSNIFFILDNFIFMLVSLCLMYSYKIGTRNELHLYVYMRMHSVLLKVKMNFNFHTEMWEWKL